MRRLTFDYEPNSAPTLVYYKNRGGGQEQARDVPDGHSIVGVYGAMKDGQAGGKIDYLGFILSRNQ